MPTTAWSVTPSGPLHGDVHVRGSKNAVTKHMVAAILGDGPSQIRNVPEVGDVAITRDMLRSLGVAVEHDEQQGVITVGRGDDVRAEVPLSFTGLNRIPILLLGPLLHLAGEAFVPLVGGDRIGRRPVDFHIEALTALGAEIEHRDDGIVARATRLRGARLELPYPSVGATETVLLTAALAEGRTVLRNAATEPEVIELALFLQRMGARIVLSPGRKWTIDGVDRLQAAEVTLEGDRNEAFSYLVAGLVTGGDVRVHGCRQDRLVTALTTLRGMGARFDITDDYVLATAPEGLRPAAVQTDTHPGFMTDWQTPLMVLFTQASGMSVLHETVYEDRLVYVPALQQMGAEIELFSTCLGGESCRFHDTNAVHSAVVKGVSRLRGAEVEVPDVRAGFSSVIAAAIADSPSRIGGIRHLVRGYHRPAEQFAELGLSITPAD
ncbi:UDP-N-acetylglucosamine 1-carboxyvinyltransferase [Ornithinimicrobium sp. F0845]|uniref:UDP-N-acetylglucosamine 1-carboxyvinyltransferase n=1 Tax=Ornithinimicrobium sp. F0845 TaxID=2926412 RepID=UPI001FF20AAE|nr:UDP-N-acetylglucosamine 1-carboxyvinyltransferase [Ornithinimicrobium sp. F0845]MCK0110738.1 UDP-N-acetylglucosamine 1-carboxyvinyltransferase [Ornithinimicrobium sp. F0845]